MPVIISTPQPRKVKTIEVTITLDRRANRLKISPQDAVRLSLDEPQEIKWRSEAIEGGSVVISFYTASGNRASHDSPFNAHYLRCPPGGACLSGLPLKNKARKEPYKYTVRLVDQARKQIAVGEAAGEIFVALSK